MLSEAVRERFLGFVRPSFAKTKEITFKEPELPRVRIGNLPEAEEFFIVIRNSIFPQNLSRENPTYHNANGFFFKISPVESNNINGADTMSVERRRNKDDIIPLDVIEITRNFIEPGNPKLATDYSYRAAVMEKGVAKLVSFKNKEAKTRIKNFLAAMIPPLETGNYPSGF